MTPDIAQDLREAKDWLVQHKRDPFLWLVILGPLALAAPLFWGLIVFPPSGAVRAVRQVLPNADVSFGPKNFPSCRGKKYVFGYDLKIRTDGGPYVDGLICRDVVNGGWVLAVDNPKF